jgi:ABC transport system ATP-binding/permease protein
VTSTLVFEGAGRVEEYVGGYSDWLQQRKPPSQPSASPGAAAPPKAVVAAAAPKPRRLSYNEQRELKLLPEKIQHLEAEKAQLHTLISDPAVFQRHQDQAAAALQRLAMLAAELEAAYSRWDALETSANSGPRT